MPIPIISRGASLPVLKKNEPSYRNRTAEIRAIRIIFLLLVIFVCASLALRPIPSVFDHNDTGRYIDSYHQVCNAPVSFDWSARLTWETYNLLTVPACLAEFNELYLFFFAIPVPLAFVVFGVWRRGSLLMACGFLFSFACFEFMTNALRQSASLFFFLGAFAFIGRPKYQLLFCIPALLLHDSTLTFIPLLLLLSYLKSNQIKLKSGAIYALIAVSIAGLALLSLNSVYFEGGGDFDDLFDVFQTKYEDEQSLWFQLFVALPVVWIFFARWFHDRVGISMEERVAIGYFAVFFIITAVLFPYIPYRLAMTGVALQLLLAMRNNKTNSLAHVWIFWGLIIHFLVYAFFSKNLTSVLFG